MEKNATSLLICLGALGDFLLALPLLRGLSVSGPVAVLSRRIYTDLLPPDLRDIPFLDINSRWAGLLFAGEAALPEQLHDVFAQTTVHALMKPEPTLERALMAAGVRNVLWYNPKPQSPPHVSKQLLQAAGILVTAAVEGSILVPAGQHDKGSLWLHPGSGSTAKNLDLEFFARAAQFWRDRGGGRVAVSFGEADLALIPAVEDALSAVGVIPDLVVLPSLRELRARLADEAELFIGADTGVTHLAACLGIPVIVGFRCTDPRIWHPLGNHRVIMADTPQALQMLLREMECHLERTPDRKT